MKLKKNTEQASLKDIKQYQQEVGSLIYLFTKTRPNIAYNINTCARFISNPNKTHSGTKSNLEIPKLYPYLKNNLF